MDIELGEGDSGEYLEFLVDLDQQYPPEKLKEMVLTELRRSYRQAGLRLKELEAENRNARIAGMSYKDRQSFTEKLKAGQRVAKELKDLANHVKANPPDIFKMVTPLDAPRIQERGFETWLNSALLVYPQSILGSPS